jgi:hypothetical protein
MIFNLPHQKDKAISYIERMDKEMICEVKKRKNNRSLVQNNYYWFILTMLQDENGTDKDDFHIYFRSKFLLATKEINDEIVEYTKSTAALSTMEFEDYMTKIRTFATVELGCFLPLPNETNYDYLKL